MTDPVEYLSKLQDAGADLSDLLTETCRLSTLLIQGDIDRTLETGEISATNRPKVRALLQYMHDLTQAELVMLNAKTGPQS